MRAPFLRPLKTSFRAPARVALYLFKPGGCVVENFNDEPVEVELNGEKLMVTARGWCCRWE